MARTLPEDLAPQIVELEAKLRQTSERLPGPYADLLDVMFKAGGKRIRPSLVFAAARFGQPDPAAVLNLAAAVESLHAATLIHDDIVDESSVRRGVPTLNTRWGVGATVLAGDWLFARSARFATATGRIRVIEIFARTLQTLTDGELRQLLSRQSVPSVDEYERRIYAKTASLFEAATEMAAVVADLDAVASERLADFGRELGMAFQIVDDILDFTGDDRRLGKPVGSDLRSGTLTLPALLYAERQGLDPRELRAADDAGKGTLIQAIAADAEVIAAAAASARGRLHLAFDALGELPSGEARDLLEDIARQSVERDF